MEEKKLGMQDLCDVVRQTAYEAHLYFAAGYLEKVYENALAHRLAKKGLAVKRQVPIKIADEDGFVVGDYVADMVVEDSLIVELKAVAALLPVHQAQLLNYLRATGMKHGLLLNFGSQKFEVKKLVL